MTLPVQVEVLNNSVLGTLQGLLIVRVCKGSKMVEFLCWIGIMSIPPLSLSLNRYVFLGRQCIDKAIKAVRMQCSTDNPIDSGPYNGPSPNEPPKQCH